MASGACRPAVARPASASFVAGSRPTSSTLSPPSTLVKANRSPLARRTTGFTKERIGLYAKANPTPGADAVSDGLLCFAAVAEAGFAHTVIITGSGAERPTEPAFKWVNTVLGDVKAVFTGTCPPGPALPACRPIARRLRIPHRPAHRSPKHGPQTRLRSPPRPAHSISHHRTSGYIEEIRFAFDSFNCAPAQSLACPYLFSSQAIRSCSAG